MIPLHTCYKDRVVFASTFKSLFFSRILFVIVFTFVFCSLPRTILNLIELEHMLVWYYTKYFNPDQTVHSAACFEPSVGFRVFCYVSNLLMTINASMGFLVYCLVCSQFKKQFKLVFRNIYRFFFPQLANENQV